MSIVESEITPHLGDCMTILPTLPDNSVHRVVTSPPYFALRSYLPVDHPDKSREIGSEPTPDAFIATMVAVFREVRRVMRDDGVLFLNLGDSYSAAGWECHRRSKVGSVSMSPNERKPSSSPDVGDGQLLNIPHRVAEALRADGWIWRQTIVWGKKSPMPESVSGWAWKKCKVKIGDSERAAEGSKHAQSSDGKPHSARDGKEFVNTAKFIDCPGCDKCAKHGGYVLRRGKGRCTTAHEYVFIFAKTDRYFWDSAASAEEATSTSGGACVGKQGNADAGARKMSAEENASIRSGTRNPRSVWTLSSEPSSEKHFATYPSELVRRCLISGPCAGGVCGKCGAPYAPVVEVERDLLSGSGRSGNDISGKHNEGLQGGGETGDTRRGPCAKRTILEYRPTCACKSPKSKPVCLDPFSGIGTTGQTAIALGYDYIGIDINEVYNEIARRRILEPPRWKLRREKKKRVVLVRKEQGILFAETEAA